MTKQEYDELNQSADRWKKAKRTYDLTRNQVFGMNASFILVIFGILFIYVFSKKEATSSVIENKHQTETPKTEDKQVIQEPQEQERTNQKYASHNFYGNNVTEYLETDTSGNIFYSTSTRPNKIKMIVKKNGVDEFELTFPSGAGDNQRYGMRKSSNILVVFIPNTDAKEQIYTNITNAGSL